MRSRGLTQNDKVQPVFPVTLYISNTPTQKFRERATSYHKTTDGASRRVAPV